MGIVLTALLVALVYIVHLQRNLSWYKDAAMAMDRDWRRLVEVVRATPSVDSRIRTIVLPDLATVVRAGRPGERPVDS